MPANTPLRPRQHQTGDAATRAFENSLPDRWVANPSLRDYGWDYIVTTTAPDNTVENEFFAQVKGSESLDFGGAGDYVNQTLDVATIKWLSEKAMPVMVAVCNVSDPTRPVYWAWLSEAVSELDVRRPDWRRQATATIRLPANSRLDRDADDIAAFVSRAHADRRLDSAVAEVLLPIDLRRSFASPPSWGEPTRPFVQDQVIPAVLSHLGLSATASQGTPTDSRRAALERVAALLDSFRDTDAERMLDTLDPASFEDQSLEAMYRNQRGILLLRHASTDEALNAFRIASALQPTEPKYAVNVLVAEDLNRRSGEPPPPSWEERLEALLQQHPNFGAALALKIRHLAPGTDLIAVADSLALDTREPGDRKRLLLALADAALSARSYANALSFAGQAESDSGADDADISSLKAYALLRLALSGRDSTPDSTQFFGFGPSNLSLRAINAAADAYEEACTAFAKLGYPSVSEETFFNATSAFVLAQRTEAAERHLRACFQVNPSSKILRSALALALTHLDLSHEAVTFAGDVYVADGDAASFRNYLLTLFRAEEFELLIDVVTRRNSAVAQGIDETTLALELTAIAHAALGRFAESESALNALRHSGRGGEAAAAALLIDLRAGADRTELVQAARQGLRSHPDNSTLLTVAARALSPPTADVADDVIDVIRRLATHRQLGPDEAVSLGRAYCSKSQFAEAAEIFGAARIRFPGDVDLIAEHAQALFELGQDEDAYIALREFLKLGRRSFSTYRNLGQLAWLTGRTSDAVRFFEGALSRTVDPSEKAELHCQLFELNRRQGRQGKDLLRHVVRYGEYARSGAEGEARYLTMFMLTPNGSTDETDSEVSGWVADFQQRLAKFSEDHPRFHSLRAIPVADSGTDEERSRDLINTMMAIVMPTELLRGQLSIRLRAGAWPLALRSEWRGARSLFAYWDHCVLSDNHTDGVHIFGEPQKIDIEVEVAAMRGPVCIDIVSLLVLHRLSLLDEVAAEFDHFVVAASTRTAVEHFAYGVVGDTHPIASALQKWLVDNRGRIRTRRPADVRRQQRVESGFVQANGVWSRAHATAGDMVGAGVGDTLLLAEHLRLPLYSDELLMRIWASEKGVPCFSTVALLRQLTKAGRVRIEHETQLVSLMIRSNFRYVPFSVEHVVEGARQALALNVTLTSDAINSHACLGPIVRQFGSRDFDFGSLLSVGIGACIDLCRRDEFSDRSIAELLATVSFKLAQHKASAIQLDTNIDPGPIVYAFIWSRLLLQCYLTSKQPVRRCWLAIQGSAELIHSTREELFRKILHEEMPPVLARLLRSVSPEQAVLALAELPSLLGDQQLQAVWEETLLRQAKANGLVQ